jgi:hypothetical protein
MEVILRDQSIGLLVIGYQGSDISDQGSVIGYQGSVISDQGLGDNGSGKNFLLAELNSWHPDAPDRSSVARHPSIFSILP